MLTPIKNIWLNLHSMDLNEISTASDQLDEENKQAILKVINLKVEDDMKDALTKIDSMFAKFDSKLAQIDTKFEHVEDKISTVYWVIGLSVGLSTAITAIFIALKK